MTDNDVKDVSGYLTVQGHFYPDKEVAKYQNSLHLARLAINASLAFSKNMSEKDIIRLVTQNGETFRQLIDDYNLHEEFLERQFEKETILNATHDTEQDEVEEETPTYISKRGAGRIPPPSTDTENEDKNLEDTGD